MEQISDYILHNDHHMVVINKPSGLSASSQANGEKGMLELVSSYTKCKLYPINRLDTPVSGIMIAAKSSEAAAKLNKQFASRKIIKMYLAVTRQMPNEKQGQWMDQIGKSKGRNMSMIDPKGLEACTDFQWVESLDHVHLLGLRPLTGRHHQLRVQMSHHLAPIRGDQKYGDKRGNPDRSIDLHACYIELKHPSTGQKHEFVAPLPQKAPWKHFEIAKHEDYVRRIFKN